MVLLHVSYRFAVGRRESQGRIPGTGSKKIPDALYRNDSPAFIPLTILYFFSRWTDLGASVADNDIDAVEQNLVDEPFVDDGGDENCDDAWQGYREKGVVTGVGVVGMPDPHAPDKAVYGCGKQLSGADRDE